MFSWLAICLIGGNLLVKMGLIGRHIVPHFLIPEASPLSLCPWVSKTFVSLYPWDYIHFIYLFPHHLVRTHLQILVCPLHHQAYQGRLPFFVLVSKSMWFSITAIGRMTIMIRCFVKVTVLPSSSLVLLLSNNKSIASTITQCVYLCYPYPKDCLSYRVIVRSMSKSM